MEAISEEFVSLIKNNTWKVVDRPAQKNVIGCRTVLRNKFMADGTVERRKARAVAHGFKQRIGIDYHESYAPVTRLSSIRLLLALAVKHDLKIRQLDITTAYLNRSIEENIYMELPKLLKESLQRIVQEAEHQCEIKARASNMLKDLESGDKVCLLQKSLYGLKQAGHQWNMKINEILKI